MELKTKYDLQQRVYLVHDPDQAQRMITEIKIVHPKLHVYLLICGADESWHYEYEISLKENILIKTAAHEE